VQWPGETGCPYWFDDSSRMQHRSIRNLWKKYNKRVISPWKDIADIAIFLIAANPTSPWMENRKNNLAPEHSR